MSTRAVLVLESGQVFPGLALGATGQTLGEAVFNTSMTGYQEILTDPSYAGQIVVMTAPHIGNTGINPEDVESRRPWCAGLVVREASPLSSSWRARGGLHEYLASHGIVGIQGVDTRALTRALRTGGAQRAAIVTGIDAVQLAEPTAKQPTESAAAAVQLAEPAAKLPTQLAAILGQVRAAPAMEGQDLASTVTCAAAYPWPPAGDSGHAGAGNGDSGTGDHGDGNGDVWQGIAPLPPLPRADLHVVAYDYGIKHTILRRLRRAGCRVTVVPAHTPAEIALGLHADGFFLSNGPGDPAAVTGAADCVRTLVDAGKPVFGICLGHQILALALGARTYKLRFGHHGGNHPVKELATGRVSITAHNHGFAVDAASLPAGVACTHVNLYDQTVEGLELVGRPVFGIQYHPEASPGPLDAIDLFDRFVVAMRARTSPGQGACRHG